MKSQLDYILAEDKLRVFKVPEEDIKALLHGLGDKPVENQQFGNVQDKAKITLLSPADGLVIDRDVVVGNFYETSNVLMTIAPLDHLWVWVNVYELDQDKVKVDQTMEIQFPFLAERVQGKVQYVANEVSKDTRAVRVRASIRNPGARLKADMLVKALLDVEPKKGQTHIPRLSMVTSNGADYAFVRKASSPEEAAEGPAEEGDRSVRAEEDPGRPGEPRLRRRRQRPGAGRGGRDQRQPDPVAALRGRDDRRHRACPCNDPGAAAGAADADGRRIGGRPRPAFDPAPGRGYDRQRGRPGRRLAHGPGSHLFQERGTAMPLFEVETTSHIMIACVDDEATARALRPHQLPERGGPPGQPPAAGRLGDLEEPARPEGERRPLRHGARLPGQGRRATSSTPSGSTCSRPAATSTGPARRSSRTWRWAGEPPSPGGASHPDDRASGRDRGRPPESAPPASVRGPGVDDPRSAPADRIASFRYRSCSLGALRGRAGRRPFPIGRGSSMVQGHLPDPGGRAGDAPLSR